MTTLDGLFRLSPRVEATKVRGRTLGLSEEQIEEVVEAWAEWAKVRPVSVPWDLVDVSMGLYACGEEWRP